MAAGLGLHVVLGLAAGLGLHVVLGPSVALWGLHAGRQQDLHTEADSLGLEDAVGVVEPQDVCGGQTEQFINFTSGCRDAARVGVLVDSQTPGCSQVSDPSSGTKWAL